MLWVLRGLFGIIILGMATSALVDLQHNNEDLLGLLAFGLILLIGVGTVAGDLSIRNKQITTISAVYFGLLLGLLLGTLFWLALEPFIVSADSSIRKTAAFQLLRLLITLVCCYLS